MMASYNVTNKAVLDIEDCVFELKRYFIDEKIPVTDDSLELHRLEEKLETVLQFGLKDKPGVFGIKKSYWDYICTCFASSKRVHEGIKFVKSKSELKSSLGRGRSLIRFCLLHKCLADTLQSCFMNTKVSRDFYSERCLPIQPKLWSPFITSLYDLNEINFDLNPVTSELDISWPSFARKLFLSSVDQMVPSINAASNSILSQINRADSCDFDISADKEDLTQEARRLMQVNADLEANVLYLQKKCEKLEKEISSAAREGSSSEISAGTNNNLSLGEFQTEDNSQTTLNNNFCNDAKFNSDSKDEKNNISKEVNSNLKSECTCYLNPQISSEKPLENIRLPSAVKPFLDSSINQCSLSIFLPNSPSQTSAFLSQKAEKDTTSSKQVQTNPIILLNDTSCSELLSAEKVNEMIENGNFPFNSESTEYCNMLIVEMQHVLDNLLARSVTSDSDIVTSAQINSVKLMRDQLESIVLAIFKHMKAHEKKQLNQENYVDCMKSLASKQDILVDSLSEKINTYIKGHEKLFDKLNCLKDKLQSFGLLKVHVDGSNEQASSNSFKEKSSDVDAILENVLIRDTEFLTSLPNQYIECFTSFKNSCSKLYTANEQAGTVQLLIDSSCNLNSDLIHRVQNHELQMKGITRELEEAHNLLSVMRQQHQKLHSAESIIKYDLQEKRKLLNLLKQQLESTREDCNQVRLKNSKSEIEWQNLRKEFVQRNKQTSEESGFVDDKFIEDQNSGLSSGASENVFTDIASKDAAESCNVEAKQEMKKSRLQLLEEQCQTLCNNLIHTAEKRKEIDSRLEEWCKSIEKSQKEVGQSVKSSETHIIENGYKECTNETINDKLCINFISGADNSLSSSEIESLNSDSGSLPPAESTDPPEINSFGSSIVNNLSTENNNVGSTDSLYAPESGIVYLDNSNPSDQTYEDFSLKSMESIQVDSHCSSMESLEGCLKNEMFTHSIEEPHETHCISDEKSTDFIPELKCVTSVEDENKLLKYDDLEKENLLITDKLNQTVQQLKITEETKEREITALRFQLNSEVLKYEKSLQECSENNLGLKDMRQKVSDQEQLILTLEEALSEIQVERETEKENQWEQLQDIQLALDAREEECFKLSSDIEKLEELRKISERDRELMEAEMLHMQNDSRELRKKIIKLLKEKDTLWKMNDRLKFLQKVQIDDRWMNDREVSECTECKSLFSFILRKHHCRHCGRIFCNTCSNNWLLTPSSRNQIRVCNECYAQYLEIKDDVRKDSWVEYDNESDDCGDESPKLVRSLSQSSDIQPNKTNSVVSLPTMKVTTLKQKSLFKSAPELNLEHHSATSCNTSFSDYSVLARQMETDISSNLLVRAGEEALLPILNGTNTTSVHWSFDLPCEAIPICLTYEDVSNNGFQQTLHQSACETEGVIHLPLPGLYKFHFDNRSRFSSLVVRYTFKPKELKAHEF